MGWLTGDQGTGSNLCDRHARGGEGGAGQSWCWAGGRAGRERACRAQGLVRLGVGQMIVAGGETSGAVVQALDVKGLRIGPEIDPGVPWTATLPNEGGRPLALALKSGNFGTPDFFFKAWDRLP